MRIYNQPTNASRQHSPYLSLISHQNAHHIDQSSKRTMIFSRLTIITRGRVAGQIHCGPRRWYSTRTLPTRQVGDHENGVEASAEQDQFTTFQRGKGKDIQATEEQTERAVDPEELRKALIIEKLTQRIMEE